MKECDDCISRQAVLEVIRKCHCEEWVKADIAAPIEALQPVMPVDKQESCDDAISRQAAINVVVKDILSSAIVYGRTEEGMAARKAIVECLKRLPPVTPAEKPNKWMAADVLNHWIGAEVLDKIRDEIAHLHDWAFDREGVLRIIDKYKAESEAK